MSGGIIYEYEDGGSYCGELEGDTSHGLGVCTGPKGEGTFEGRWDHGNQLSGVYRWPNGVQYSGQWADNTRHGMGMETRRDGTEFSGEFTRGTRGTFGVAKLPNGLYQGQWAHGAQDGEGVETYRDHGCYRGQYRKGLRSGFGTRTSAAYEARGESDHSLPTSISDPSLSSKTLSDQRLNSLKKSRTLHRQKDSVASLGPTSLKDEVAQVYEGEWVNDKRHGHGILKVLGKYTYYGQWSSNTRTGHGVLLNEDGTKEEGEWHNGTRVAIVKRHKVLLFKSHQLEQKVKEAHTKSLQAAEKARSKAELAVVRATSAVNRSQLAAGVAEKAFLDAKEAIVKAELYKNAPTVSEAVKTPGVGPSDIEFPSIDPTRAVTAPLPGGSSLDSNRLAISQTIAPSTSFDDLCRATNSDSGRGLGSDSPESQRHRQSNDSISSSDDSIPRRFYQRSSQSSSTESCGTPRRSSHSVTQRQHEKLGLKRSLSDHEEEYSGSEYRVQRLLRQRRNHRTGEVEEEVSDHEGNSPDNKSLPGKPADITIDMLNQMAKWNRTVAFLNFGLLVVLLVLILAVFVSMYYYRLVSYYRDRPDLEEQSRPGGFLTPLA